MLEHLIGPWWEELGARVDAAVLDNQGHVMPGAKVCEAAFEFLEGGVAKRRELAGKYRASRIRGAPTREEWAAHAFADARLRLAADDPAEIDVALRQLEGAAARWADLPAAAEAKGVTADYASRASRPWEQARSEHDLRVRRVVAEGLDALAHDGRPAAREQRSANARQAIQWWQQLRETSDAELQRHADERIAALEKIAAEKPPAADATVLRRVRFAMNGDVTLPRGIGYMRTALARIGFELRADEPALAAAGVDLTRVHKPRLQAATFEDIDRRFFRRAGVRTVRRENVIEVLPLAVSAKE